MFSKYILLAGLVLGVTGIGYWYFTWTNNKIETLTTANAVLTIENATLEDQLETTRQDIALARAERQALSARLESAESYQDELINKLQRHDLTRLALKKPGLIQTRINNGTQEIFNELESITSRPAPADSVRNDDTDEDGSTTP